MHHLALTITKKTLDENRFKNAQKTTDHIPPSFQVSDRVYFKTTNLENGIGNGELDMGLSVLNTLDITSISKSGNRKDPIMQCQRCCTQTTS